MADERTADFGVLFNRVLGSLQQVFGTSNTILIFTSSTTGAFEGAVQNLFSPGERVLVVNGGAFGNRWVRMCQAFGLSVTEYAIPWGQDFEPAVLAEYLRGDPDIVAAIAVHCETSTGVVTDLKAFSAATRDVLSIVDSASGLGACELRADDWGLDVVISGTQKGLMAPPGISFAAIGERAWRRHERARLSRYYFDWSIARDSLAETVPHTPWTPAIGVLVQLDAALAHVLAEGLDARLSRHILLGRLARAGLRGLGLRLLTPALDRNAVVTAAYVPDGVNAEQLVNTLAERTGVQLTPGLGAMSDRIIRLGHCGYIDALDVVTGIAALEMTLHHLRIPVPAGAGLVPLMQVLADGERLPPHLSESPELVASNRKGAPRYG